MTASDFDSPWKQALDAYFEDFLAFFFPNIHQDIAWEKAYETLDKELQEIVRDAETGTRFADQLVKVFLRDGQEKWLLIHIEVQSQARTDFAKRMYIYNHRLFDRYNRKVISLAVLADERESWRPREFGYELWGFESYLRFPTVKLLDYQPRWQELEESTNPFAFVVMAHLKTKATTGNVKERFRGKLTLMKLLYEGGYTKNKVLELFRFLDWMMVLPEEVEDSFRERLNLYEEEKKMPYVTSVERLSKQEGIQEGTLKVAYENLITVIETRFATTILQSRNRFDQLRAKLKSIKDVAFLKRLLKKALTASSWEEFAEFVELKQVAEVSQGELLNQLSITRDYIIYVLQARFSVEAEEETGRYEGLRDSLQGISDLEKLKDLLKKAATIDEIEEFEATFLED